MHLSWIFVAIPFLWISICVTLCRKAYFVLTISKHSQFIVDQGLARPSWIPFLRKNTMNSKLPSLFTLILRGCTDGPIRLIAFFLVAVLACIGSLLLPRSVLVAEVCLLSRLSLYILKIKVSDHGVHAFLPQAPCIVANHVSFLDVLAFLSIGCSFVAKESARRIPLVGRIAAAIGCIFVERDSSQSRSSARESIKITLHSVRNSSQLVIFPEGTITNGEGMLQFRRGGFDACVPVQPVRIEYSNLQVSLSLLKNWELLCFLCCMPSIEMHLHYLPVMTADTPEALSVKCRKAIANAGSLRPLTLFGSESFRDERECCTYLKQTMTQN